MRRQIGSQTRKAISKSISKAKKNKHTNTQQHEPKDKKPDRQIFKAIYHQTPIKQLSFIFSQLDEHRLNEKLAQIELFAEKMLDSEQKKKLEEMTTILVQEQRIHNLIEFYIKQNNHEKARQQSEMMKRIQERKKIFFKETLNRCQGITISTGVFTNELIARQGSPKMKFQPILGFSDISKKILNKKQDEYAVELKNKDLVIKRLFQRIELLEMSNNKFDRQKSFKQNMEFISSKYVQSQRKNIKMARQVEQMQNKKQQVINEIEKYRKDYNQLLNDYDQLNQKYLDLQRQFKEENTQKQQLERKHKDFERYYSENNQLKQKYQELQEEFNCSIEEKLEWERKYNKVLKEKNIFLHKITELRTKIKEFLKDQVPQLRNIVKITQNRLKQFNESIMNVFIIEQFAELSNTVIKKYQHIIDQQVQRQKAFVQIISLKTKQCQDLSIINRKHSQKEKNHFEQIVQKTKLCEKLLKMTEAFQVNITKIKNQHAEYRKSVQETKKQRKNRLSVTSTLSETISFKQNQNLLSITNFQILRFQGQNEKLDASIQTKDYKPTLKLQKHQSYLVYQSKNQNQTNQTGIQTQDYEKDMTKLEICCQTDYSEKNENSVQTDSKIKKQVDSQCSAVQKISTFTQTQRQTQFIKQDVVSLCYQAKKIENLQCPSYRIQNTLSIQILTCMSMQTTGVQTQEYEVQSAQHCLDFKIIEEEQFNTCSQNDILKMLADAQDCVNVPDIAILREQIVTYREQIDRLKNVIRQHQKQKQEENVFNFRL